MSNITCLNVAPMNYSDFLYIIPLRYSVATVWAIICLITFIGNILVILTIAMHKSMQTATNYYILNLAVTDLLVAILVIPFKGVQFFGTCKLSLKIFNKLSCALFSFVLMVLVFTSLLTLVVISIERFLAIAMPLRSILFQSRTKIKGFILLTWVIPMIICLPQALYSKPVPFYAQSEFGDIRFTLCLESMDKSQRIVYMTVCFVFLFLLPLLVVLITSLGIIRALMKPAPGSHNLRATLGGQKNSRGEGTNATNRNEDNKRKVAKMIIVVVFLYIVSWAPWFIVNLIGVFYTKLFNQNYTFTMSILHMIGFMNSMSNPFIYYFMSKKFRTGYIDVVRCILKCQKTVIDGTQANATRKFPSATMEEMEMDHHGVNQNTRMELVPLNTKVTRNTLEP